MALADRIEHSRHRFRIGLRYRLVIITLGWVGVVIAAALAVAIRAMHAGMEPGLWDLTVVVAVLARCAWLRPPTAPHWHDPGPTGDREPCPEPAPDRSVFVWVVRSAAVLYVLAFAVGAPVLVVAVLAAVTAAFASVVVLDKAGVVLLRRRLKRRLQALGPRWALAYGGYAGGPIHLTMWAGHLAESGDTGVVFNLREHYCAELRAGARLELGWVQLGSDALGDLRVITVPSIRTFFYVHNAPGHLRMLGIQQVRHVWLGHGDSDKAGSRHTRHRRYDILAVSGQAAIDRYVDHGLNIPAERFKIIGRPQVRDVAVSSVPVSQIARPRVFYAPTWIGSARVVNFSSIDHGTDLVRRLIERGHEIVFRPHPVFLRTEERHRVEPIWELLAADAAESGRHHDFGERADSQWSVFECMNHADVLISDVSSVVSDWLASSKPYAIINMVHEAEEFAEKVPVARGAYVIDRDFGNLDEALDLMLGSDPLAQARADLSGHVLGGLSGAEAADNFARFVAELGRMSPPER